MLAHFGPTLPAYSGRLSVLGGEKWMKNSTRVGVEEIRGLWGGSRQAWDRWRVENLLQEQDIGIGDHGL